MLRKMNSVLLVALFVASSTVAGCASHSDVRKQFMVDVNQGNYASAEAALREIGGKKKIDYLVDVCDMAMVLSRAGRYREANEFLQKADDKIREYFTKNVSDVLAAIGWNESQANYKGEEFERNMVDLIHAMNFLSMGDYDAARIEATQANVKLGDFVELLRRNNVTSGFVSDPFAYFLTGLAFEAAAMSEGYGAGQWDKFIDEARLAYTKAWNDYQNLGSRYGIDCPEGLRADLERVKAFACNENDMPQSGECIQEAGGAEIVVITGIGQIPHKQSLKWIQSDGRDNVVITYPEFFPSPTRVQASRVVTGDGEQVYTDVIYDLGKVAVEVNKERLNQLKDKAIARAMAKYVAKKAARAAADIGRNVGGSGGGIASLIGNFVNLGIQVAEAVEVADTRSWMTLPDRYTMVRLPAEPGLNKLNVEFVDGSGYRVNTVPVEANVEPNGRTFVILYSFDREGVAATRRFGPGMNSVQQASGPAAQSGEM